MAQPYENNWEHLSAELSHLDLLIHCQVLKGRRALPKGQQEGFKGIFISEGEIDVLLGLNASAFLYRVRGHELLTMI